MPGYLPLCVSRQDLLPPACRSCAWWQTSVKREQQILDAAEKRRQWMLSVGSTWGSPGLLREEGEAIRRSERQSTGPREHRTRYGTPSQDFPVAASIHYAPAAAVPRLNDLPFSPPGEEAVLVFCLRSEGDQAETRARRILQRALGQLKDRGIQEAYAFAGLVGSPEDQGRCHFFSLAFLESNGFQHVMDNGDIYLMRADLRGLVSLISQAESALRRMLRHDPTPSPAAWTRRGA